MQILFKGFCIDHYPYHQANQNSKHWNNYNHTLKKRNDWSKKLIDDFVSKIQKILQKTETKIFDKIKFNDGINLLESCTVFILKDFLIYKVKHYFRIK
jgi:hypothetical protein